MQSAAPIAFTFVMLFTLVAGGAQTSALQIHDLAAMTPFPLGRMQARGAMGQTGSIMITELPPGLKTTPHHHHQEQMMLGLSGRMHYLMGDTPQPLPRFRAALALANVRHGNINDTSDPAVCIEFQPVQRPDWFPPHPRVAREGSPEPVSPPAGRAVTADFDAVDGWQVTGTGSQWKSLVGETMKLTMWQLSSGPGARAVIQGPPVERFIVVLYGAVMLSDGSANHTLKRETLVIAPPATPMMSVRPDGDTGAVLAVYERLPR